MTKKTTIELTESELDHAQGGLLLPAVQKVREASNTTTAAMPYIEQDNVIQSNATGQTGGGAHVKVFDGRS